MALSYAEIDKAYRATLRRLAQERARSDALRHVVLTLKGRLFGATQAIDDALERIEREHGRNTLGHDLDAIASADVRVTPVTGDSAR